MEITPPEWPVNPPCPWLPGIPEALGVDFMKPYRKIKGPDFCLAALSWSQSLWMSGKPAQAILQINKSFMSIFSEKSSKLSQYQSLAWIVDVASSGDCGFMGNPVRHFQHLATRMSGPHAEIRKWRAWACFHLVERILPPGFPRDGRQIVREGIFIPGLPTVLARIGTLGWKFEREDFLSAYQSWRRLSIASPKS